MHTGTGTGTGTGAGTVKVASSSTSSSGFQFMNLIQNPFLWAGVCIAGITITFMHLITTLNITSLSNGNSIQGWWGATIGTSMVVLLGFFVSFRSAVDFNERLINLLVLTFIVTYIGLLYNQQNLTF